MTGVGKGVSESENWRVMVFIKTLNSKGLETSVKSNINLYEFELDIRNLLKDHIKRGTTSVVIQIEPKLEKSPLDLQSLVKTFQTFKSFAQELNINLSDDMAFYASLRYAERKEEELNDEIKFLVNQALLQALKELIRSREEEGRKLKEDLIERIEIIKANLAQIVERKDELLERLKQRILERAKELNLSESNPTVLNEMVFLLSKMDIEEELARFKIHIKRFEDLLNSEEEVGRRLDFLLQEMHREINTLGNKMPELSKWVVDIKVEIDRLKQQVANVE
ncbi:YicC family protein [Thermocrinis sp.]